MHIINLTRFIILNGTYTFNMPGHQDGQAWT